MLGRTAMSMGARRAVAPRFAQPRRGLAGETEVVRSPASKKAPLTTRLSWFSYGLNITLALGLYQLGQDASDVAKKLEEELKKIREDTAATQRGLRAKISKLEAALGEAAKKLEEKA